MLNRGSVTRTCSMHITSLSNLCLSRYKKRSMRFLGECGGTFCFIDTVGTKIEI